MRAGRIQDVDAPLRRVLVRPPSGAFAVSLPGDWGYQRVPELSRACEEHADFRTLLEGEGVEVVRYEEELPGLADALFVYDPVLVTGQGVVVLRMGKPGRQNEETGLAGFLESMGWPLLGRIEAPGTVEGGDLLWLDDMTLVVGLGFRTNREGVRQLADLVRPAGLRVEPVALPFHGGPSRCLHLLSLISRVSEDTVLVYEPLLPVPLWRELMARGVRLLRVPCDEFETLGVNVLALGEGRCVVLEGNPRTRRILDEAGFRVCSYRGEEISLIAEGGPTCLTLPLVRGGAREA